MYDAAVDIWNYERATGMFTWSDRCGCYVESTTGTPAHLYVHDLAGKTGPAIAMAILVGTDGGGTGPRAPGARGTGRSNIAANKAVDIGGARFAQTSYSETFGKRGLFSGQTIDDVAGTLRSGAISSKEVPIKRRGP